MPDAKVEAVEEPGQAGPSDPEPKLRARRESARSAAATAAAAPASTMTLTEMMALPEPRRTEVLEKAVASGLVVNLRSRTGEEIRQSYGEHVLAVGAKAKPFTAAHAIHLLWYAPEDIEEILE